MYNVVQTISVNELKSTLLVPGNISIYPVAQCSRYKPLCRAIGAQHLVIGAEGIRERRKKLKDATGSKTEIKDL